MILSQPGRKHEKKLPQNRKQLEWFVERIGQYIYGVDRKFMIVDVNHAEMLVEYQDLPGVCYSEFPI